MPAARQGDMLIPHHPGARKITEGFGSAKINGNPPARVTDGINCGGKIIVGSGNVLIADQSEKSRNSKLSVEVEGFLKEKNSSSTSQNLTPFESTQLAAGIALNIEEKKEGLKLGMSTTCQTSLLRHHKYLLKKRVYSELRQKKQKLSKKM